MEKTLILEKINGKRRRAWQMMRRLDSLTDSMDMNLSKLRETEEEDRRGQKRTEEDRRAWHAAVHGVVELDTT